MTNLRVLALDIDIAGRKLYQNLNFEIAPHQMIGILGRNGSGKTTLLHLMAGLSPMIKGDILYGDTRLQHFPSRQRAQLIGVLFQENNDNFPQTVYEACSQGRYPYLNKYGQLSTIDESIIHTALLNMSLIDFTLKKVHTLSGGEKRRLSIARLLAQTPRIYLLDEPTNHLDIYYQQKVFDHFHILKNTHPVSIVCVTHDLRYAEKYCDNILLLFKNGEYAFGPTVDVLTPLNISRLFSDEVIVAN